MSRKTNGKYLTSGHVGPKWKEAKSQWHESAAQAPRVFGQHGGTMVVRDMAAMLLMIALMLPFFFLTMYERDGLPAEKVLRNILKWAVLGYRKNT